MFVEERRSGRRGTVLILMIWGLVLYDLGMVTCPTGMLTYPTGLEPWVVRPKATRNDSDMVILIVWMCFGYRQSLLMTTMTYRMELFANYTHPLGSSLLLQRWGLNPVSLWI